MGVVLAHVSVAQLSPPNSDCITCGRSVEIGFPTPLKDLPLNQNLAASLNGFSHGDALPAIAPPEQLQAQLKANRDADVAWAATQNQGQPQPPLLHVPTFTPKLYNAFYPMQANGQRQDLYGGSNWQQYNQLLNTGLGQPVFSNRVFNPTGFWYGGPSYIF